MERYRVQNGLRSMSFQEQHRPSGGEARPLDGRTILFDDHSSIFLVNPDGSDLRKLPLDTTGFRCPFQPSWSLDGTRIIFGLTPGPARAPGRKASSSAKADGTDLRQVTDSPIFDEDADWGPHPLAT
jgi:Tol biopolymer transport system component